MAKILTAGPALDPVNYGEVAMKRDTKGTPYSNGGTGFNLQFNHLPPGLDFSNQEYAANLPRIANLKPIGPILK
jgi:hypothetical protein